MSDDHLGRFDRKAVAPTAVRALKTVKLPTGAAFLGRRVDYGARPVQSLSGGNQQRVLIGRWLAIGP